MKNHKSRLTGFIPFSEANETSFPGNKGNRGRGRKNYRSQWKCIHNSYKRNVS
jgi:hypothetical protein